MRFLSTLLVSLLASSSITLGAVSSSSTGSTGSASASYNNNNNNNHNNNNHNNNNNKPVTVKDVNLSYDLLQKAVPLSTNTIEGKPAFMRMYRSLEEEDGDGNDDDYYMDADTMYSFSGFSLKYAKCQTIQRFSEDAIKNGEYSAMVKDDIVILRLCPTSQCNSNKQYGCHYNYAEYAIGVSDYVKIMLKYTIDKRSKMCDFCTACSGSSSNNNDDNNNDERLLIGNRKLEDEEEENSEEDEDGQQQFDDDDYYKGDDAYNDDNSDAAAASDDDAVTLCETYADECDAMYNSCNGAADDDLGYLDYADYFDYLDCVKVEGQDEDNYYWIRPRCDSYKETIHMDIYYDPYCSQYAGGDVNLREFSGIYFRTSVFEPFYDGTCVDCSESNYGPYYDSNSTVCNRLFSDSAKCTKNMMYQMFDDDGSSSTSTECSFIESVRSGTYNAKGEMYVDSSIYGEKVQMQVSAPQQAGLVISIFLCVGLGVYSCYLHHSITNLLIKSLSHSHLLPPSRHRNRGGRRSGSNGRNGRKGRRRGNAQAEDDDWDHTGGVPA